MNKLKRVGSAVLGFVSMVVVVTVSSMAGAGLSHLFHIDTEQRICELESQNQCLIAGGDLNECLPKSIAECD